MPFTVSPLAYEYDALEPHISADIIRYHYGKHTKKYFEVATELAEGTIFEHTPMENALSRQSMVKMGSKLHNNLSQAWNHDFYWKCLCPATQTGDPSSKLVEALTETFQSFELFKEQFTKRAVEFFGSGWAWLVWKDSQLQIKTTPNGGSPLSDTDSIPLLACDLWEHAYLYQSEYFANRAGYVDAWWNVINWEFVNNNFNQATSSDDAS